MADALVLGRYEKDAMLVAQASNQPLLAAFEHFNHLALRPAAPVGAGDARHHAIAVHHLAHFLRPQKQVGAAVIADKKSKAVGMPLDAAANEVEFLDHADRVAAVPHDLAIALHRSE